MCIHFTSAVDREIMWRW